MRRTLRLFLCQCLVAGLAFPLSATAQETRGKISGTVRDNAGVIPGASVKITNIDTSVTQNVTTNDSGYFEASFLIPGTYAVSVQMAG
jgi:Carboxypeptidase regulatory-like domain